MRKTLCICLLTLAIVMLFCASGGSDMALSCCMKAYALKRNWQIKACYEQQPRKGCPHAFMIKTNNGLKCLKPDTPWLKQEIKEGKLECPQEFSVKGRFEVLDEDDLE